MNDEPVVFSLLEMVKFLETLGSIHANLHGGIHHPKFIGYDKCQCACAKLCRTIEGRISGKAGSAPESEP